MIRVRIIFLLLVIFALPQDSFAGYGPIKIKLGTAGYTANAPRANNANNYEIIIHYDQAIEPGYLKFWFPIDEPGFGLNSMCDELPAITGDVESPRFLPGKKYFEKYPDSSEKEYVKLYEIKRPRDGDGLLELDVDGCSKYKDRFIEDPSGLGYWMTGTVMPKIFRDPEKRKNQLTTIGRLLDINLGNAG